MRTLGMIPVRMASTRLPGKPLIQINGKPLLVHVYELALRSSLSSVIVLSPDLAIIEYCIEHGIHCAPVPDADGVRTGTGRCIRYLDLYQDFLREPYDLYVNIQGDEPTLKPTTINELMAMMEGFPDCPVGSVYRHAHDLSELYDRTAVKCAVNEETGLAIGFYRNYPAVYFHSYVHVGLYAFQPAALAHIKTMPADADMEQRGWHLPILMTRIDYRTVSVNCETDLALASAALTT